MNELKLKIKLAFIAGLRDVVLSEISQYLNFRIIAEEVDFFYLDFVKDLIDIKKLRSVSRSYIIVQDPKYNPLYIFNHKSILDNLIEIVISGNKNKFKTFKITCSGSDSPEVRSIAEYIEKKYDLTDRKSVV